jgi:hypothetical protein
VKDELAAVQRRIAAAAEAGERDQACAPMLEALDAYRRSNPASFSIPAHKSGRALDEETLAILGDGPYRDDAPAYKGLDARADSYRASASTRGMSSSCAPGSRPGWWSKA